MFALSAGPGAYQVWRNQAELAGAYWMVVGIPATAAVAFLLASLFVPSLFGDAGLRFPRQISLPLVFTAMLPTCAALWLTTPQGLVTSFDVIGYARVWEQPGELLITCGAEMIGLTLLAFLQPVQ